MYSEEWLCFKSNGHQTDAHRREAVSVKVR